MLSWLLERPRFASQLEAEAFELCEGRESRVRSEA